MFERIIICIVAIQTFSRAGATLNVVIRETGNITYSADGVASRGTGQVDVFKKSDDAKLRIAAIACSTTFFGPVLQDGEVLVMGEPVDFTLFGSVVDPVGNSLESSYGEITSIVKDTLDNAAAGITSISVTELRQSTTDGCGVWAVFDDPTVDTLNTFIFQFGAQEQDGDSFTITIPSPLTSPNDVAEFGLAIAFGYQSDTTTGQFSEVRVNGELLTSYAGGFDDGYGRNGGLITVGGQGDTPVNPDPDAKIIEDELYDLVPFFQNSTTVFIETVNPSSDDIIFGASLFVSAETTIDDPNSDETCVRSSDCESPLTCCITRRRSLLYGGYVNGGVCLAACT